MREGEEGGSEGEEGGMRRGGLSEITINHSVICYSSHSTAVQRSLGAGRR